MPALHQVAALPTDMKTGYAPDETEEGKGKEEAQNQVIDSMTSRFSNWVGFDTMDEKFGDVYTKLTAS